MKGNNLLLGLAVVAVVVSIIAAGVTYSSIDDLSTRFTALVSQGTINLTVETLAIVNFTNNAVNFSSGRVNSAASAASLITTGSGSVTNGNWTAQGGLIIENIGNVNVSLNLTGAKTAAQFIGGTSPAYEWNVSGPGACLNQNGASESGLNINTFHNVNTTVADSEKCRVFRFEAAVDEIRIDFNLTIPDDSSTGVLTDTITATVVANNPTA